MENIKQKFYSEKNNKPFNKCVFCEGELLGNENFYVVEKAFSYNLSNKSYELVFEYALCSECIQSLSSEMSKESQDKIEKYFDANLNNNGFDKIDADKRTNICMITGDDLLHTKEYQIAALFFDDEMVVSERFPFAIGDVAIEEIQQLISEKTRDFTDKFKDIIIPPEVRDNIPKDRIIFF